MKRFIVIVYALLAVAAAFAQPLRVVSYNVENLFYPERDSLNPDSSFTLAGEHRWSYTRYYNKVENIARVLVNIGEWDGVDIVGLQEVESKECLKRLCHTLRPDTYDYVHVDSPDPRGIDVALLYKKARIDTLRTRAISIHKSEIRTRDILYVCAKADRKDTLHFFVCHMPSQRGGAAETEWKRQAVKEVLQHAVDSVLATNTNARIIIMGDMNSAPKEDIAGLSNRMKGEGLALKGQGTHKHNGQWICLDQFYTSPALDTITQVRIYDAEWIQERDEKNLGLKPKRTYRSLRYQNGFSDHLPIILDLKLR